MAGRKHSRELDISRIKEFLSYDPETGHFTWIVRSGRQRAGTRAGTIKDGYVKIICMDSEIRAHRLAFVFMTNAWPPEDMTVDHKNRVRHDNRWTNLRLATIADNTANASIRSDCTTGVTGVYAHKTNGRFYAAIQRHGKVVKLGGFATLEAAAAARRAAEISTFGEFAPHT